MTFVGGSGWRPDQAPGESVGWFPLGPHEPYIAPYRTDRTRLHNIDVEHFNYANRNVPGAVTVVPSETFVRGQPTSQAALRLPTVGSRKLRCAELWRRSFPRKRASLVASVPLVTRLPGLPYR